MKMSKNFITEDIKVNTINKVDLIAAVADKAELEKKEATLHLKPLLWQNQEEKL